MFREPWEAQAFALVVALSERGAFTWAEWTAKLSNVLRAQSADDDSGTYYRHWLETLEQLVCEKGLTSERLLAAREAAWRRAVEATPHGSPILLENDPAAHS